MPIIFVSCTEIEILMFYYNITFYIENSQVAKWKEWLFGSGIDYLFSQGYFQRVKLLHVQTPDTEAQTYSVQLETTENELITLFREKYEAKFRHLLYAQFAEKVLIFATELHVKEIIENERFNSIN